jgi:hypothetical protein
MRNLNYFGAILASYIVALWEVGRKPYNTWTAVPGLVVALFCLRSDLSQAARSIENHPYWQVN